MEAIKFDKLFEAVSRKRRSRREVLVAAAATAAVASGVTASAQESTPAPGEGYDPSKKQDMLFLQSFQSGSIVKKEGEEGTYTATLQHGLGETVYFTDRPGRIVGTTPTQQFTHGFSFGSENPPNAALVITNDEGETDIAVVELTNPSYDEASRTATYDLKVLENFDDFGGTFQSDPVDLAEVAASFGSAHLFIDDCSHIVMHCTEVASGTRRVLDQAEYVDIGGCYQWGLCQPCEPYDHTSPSPCATWYHWAGICDQFERYCPSRNCWPYWTSSVGPLTSDDIGCP